MISNYNPLMIQIGPEGGLTINGPYGYFPSKEEFLEILNYCAESLADYDTLEDHNNYLNHCLLNGLDPKTGEPREVDIHPEKSVPVIQKGYVYLAVDDALPEYIKIGYSKHPEVREGTLQAEKPTIRIIHTEQGTMAHEKELHAVFKDRRVRGEWFKITEDEALDVMSGVIPPSEELVQWHRDREGRENDSNRHNILSPNYEPF